MHRTIILEFSRLGSTLACLSPRVARLSPRVVRLSPRVARLSSRVARLSPRVVCWRGKSVDPSVGVLDPPGEGLPPPYPPPLDPLADTPAQNLGGQPQNHEAQPLSRPRRLKTSNLTQVPCHFGLLWGACGSGLRGFGFGLRGFASGLRGFGSGPRGFGSRLRGSEAGQVAPSTPRGAQPYRPLGFVASASNSAAEL